MEPPKPSAYEPIFRRLGGSERERELAEARALYEWVQACQSRFTETPETIGRRIYEAFRHVADPVDTQFIYAMYDLIIAETFIWELPKPSFEQIGRAHV